MSDEAYDRALLKRLTGGKKSSIWEYPTNVTMITFDSKGRMNFTNEEEEREKRNKEEEDE